MPSRTDSPDRAGIAAGGRRVAVVSKGDERLMSSAIVKAGISPRADDGVYSGYYPADSGSNRPPREAACLVERNSYSFRAPPSGGSINTRPRPTFGMHYSKVADNRALHGPTSSSGSASLGRLERELRRLPSASKNPSARFGPARPAFATDPTAKRGPSPTLSWARTAISNSLSACPRCRQSVVPTGLTDSRRQQRRPGCSTVPDLKPRPFPTVQKRRICRSSPGR